MFLLQQYTKIIRVLAENGKQSSSRKTRHLNVGYFFVTDKIKKGEVRVAFCSMHDTLMDIYQATSRSAFHENA